MIIKNLAPLSLIGCLAGLSLSAQAEMASLTDTEMSSVQGQGLGLVLEDFVFAHGDDPSLEHTFKITGIKSSLGEDVEVTVSKLYIARGAVDGDFAQDSNFGSVLNPVNLGRLSNPYTIDVVDGNTVGITDKAVLQIAAPTLVDPTVGFDCLDIGAVAGTGTCSSRPATSSFQGERFDLGLMLEAKVGDKDPNNLNIHAKSAVIDGSYLRLWADEDMDGGAATQLVAQFRLNLYTPELSINSCDALGQSCGDTVQLKNFELELALGNSLQPMYLDVNGSGNFVFEIKNIRETLSGTIASNGQRSGSDAATWDAFENYYNDPNGEFKSNLRIGELNVAGENFGSAKIEGLQIQYLRIESHDLGN